VAGGLLALGCAAIAARADNVVLKNGQTLNVTGIDWWETSTDCK
jgi:hypothetical protein